MAELIGGAVLGGAVQKLLEAVIGAKKRVNFFDEALTRLKSTLNSVIPRVDEICRLNDELNVPREEMEEFIKILRNGLALVYRCSEIRDINIFKKMKYSQELGELNDSLFMFFTTVVPLQQVKDTKEMLLMMRELHSELVAKYEKYKCTAKEFEYFMEPYKHFIKIKSDEGEPSNPKVDEYSEIKSSQEPDKGELSKPKVDDYSEIKFSQEPNEGELINPKEDEYFETQSCQDPEKRKTSVLLMMKRFPMRLVAAKDEGESSESKEDESSQEPDEEDLSKHDGDEYFGKKYILEQVVKIEDHIIASSTLFNHPRSELETLTFRLKGCKYIFGPEEYSINYDEKIWYQEMGTNYLANCKCNKRHGYVMVSRIDKVGIGQIEFERQMETSGKIGNHANIVPPFGYCFYQSELFLFYDSFPKGARKGASLYTRLHGDIWRVANPDSPPMIIAPHEFSLESKLKIARGVAGGISHLHSVECIHGNLHSYNVIINSDLDGCISDYGLVNFSSAAKQSDVYTFGVILLEMLSGTDPPDFEDHHRWIEEVVSVQKKIYSRTKTLFGIVDKLGRKMLKIAMLCVEKDLDKRPEMGNVVNMIQKIQKSRL